MCTKVQRRVDGVSANLTCHEHLSRRGTKNVLLPNDTFAIDDKRDSRIRQPKETLAYSIRFTRFAFRITQNRILVTTM